MDKRKAEEFVKMVYDYLNNAGQKEYIVKLEQLRKEDKRAWSEIMNRIGREIKSKSKHANQANQEQPKPSAKEQVNNMEIDFNNEVNTIVRDINQRIGKIKRDYKVYKKTLPKLLELEGTKKYYNLKQANEKKIKSEAIDLAVSLNLGMEYAKEIIKHYKQEILKYESMTEAEKELIRVASNVDVDAKLAKLKQEYGNALLLLRKQKKGVLEKVGLGVKALVMTPKKRKELMEVNKFNASIIEQIKGGI